MTLTVADIDLGPVRIADVGGEYIFTSDGGYEARITAFLREEIAQVLTGQSAGLVAPGLTIESTLRDGGNVEICVGPGAEPITRARGEEPLDELILDADDPRLRELREFFGATLRE